MQKYGWGKDIHDAFIINPEAAKNVREWYAEELIKIFNNRKAILTNYFQSIGISKSAQGQWEKVMSMVHPVETLQVNLMALK